MKARNRKVRCVHEFASVELSAAPTPVVKLAQKLMPFLCRPTAPQRGSNLRLVAGYSTPVSLNSARHSANIGDIVENFQPMVNIGGNASLAPFPGNTITHGTNPPPPRPKPLPWPRQPP
ncbi:hypothetical protein KM043_016236 [Ampulex compressa]|nr:hypothetical protein KM043_016236 [Ampulex compressa]